jgi:DNA-binding transcriptional MerR regulator
MRYTVKEVADMAGVTRRTLHYYDEIDLLKPSTVADNDYRYYEAEAIGKLQQILFFRELDFSLKEIKVMMQRPNFNRLESLKKQRAALEKQVGRLSKLIDTIDQTISHINGEIEMKTQDLFSGFDEATQEAYAEEAAQRWDADKVKASMQKWKKLSEKQKAAVMAEASEIHQSLVANMDKGYDSNEVQILVGRWYGHLHHFYQPTLEIFRGLGQGYEEDPQFAAIYEKLHPDMPAFFHAAIDYYCDQNEGYE